MKNRLDILLQRYWDGETSLEEEKELRSLLLQSEGYGVEKSFFLGIAEYADLKEVIQHPKGRIQRWNPMWFRIAAGLLVLLVSGISIYSYQQKEAEKEAYQQVMDALTLIQTNMQKGTDNLQVLEEFRHLNTTNELFDIENQ
jgi:hypothetical protein